MKIRELLEKYVGLQHEKAVWSAIRQHLTKFCSSDIGDAIESIKVEDGVYSVVQENTVRKVLQDIDDRITALGQEVRSQGALEVPQEKPVQKKVTAKQRKRSVGS